MRNSGSTPEPGGAAQVRPRRKRRRLLVVLAVCTQLAGCGLVAGGYYFDSVPTPSDLKLPESTTVYYADGRTPMAKLGVWAQPAGP